MESTFGADNVTIMSLNQMCDLALGFVHPGVIHFDLLHQIFRAIIEQCNLNDIKLKLKLEKNMDKQKFTASQKTSDITIPSTEEPINKSSDTMFPFPNTVVEKGRNVTTLSSQPREQTVLLSVEQMQSIMNSIESLQRQINEMKQLPNNQDILDSLRENRSSKSSSITNETHKINESTSSPPRPVARSLSDTPIVDMLQMLTLTKRIDAAEESITKLASLVEEIARDVTGGSNKDLDIDSLSELRGMPIVNLGNKQALELLTKELKALKHLVYGEGEDLGSAGANLQTKVTIVEVKMKQILDQVENIDRSTAKKVTNLFGQCSGLEETVERLEMKLVDALIGQKTPLMSLNERYNKLYELVDQMRLDHKKVIDANSKREMQMSALIEQLEFLKTGTITRQEFEDALDKKLDADRMLTKVSRDNFEQACDHLKMNIEETITRLTYQEEMWQKALVELQGEIVTKLEKNELTALQEFVKTKLKTLKEKMKSMKMYQTEKEAAATKQMLMKNVKCLSCDTDVVTKVKQLPQDYPKSPTLPPSKTMAPYLAYELDVMRKQQRGLFHSRNMHHFEASLRNKGQRVENRYCGGPHTVTTPVQRVTRLGHFLEQWGPEIASANENFVKGTDQKIYVGSTTESKLNKRPSVIVEGTILKERESQHEDMANIPEKDSENSELELDEKTGAYLNADLEKSSPGRTLNRSSSRKSLDRPNPYISTKIEAISSDRFPYL